MDAAVVIGAGGGIGHALVRAFVDREPRTVVFALSRTPPQDAYGGVFHRPVDVTSEESIKRAAQLVAEKSTRVSHLFYAAGLLHRAEHLQPERRLEHLDAENLHEVLAVNTVGPMLVAKHFFPLMNTEKTSCMAFLSARVGSIEDNRLGGWYAYRASKAALNMFIRTFSIESARRNPSLRILGLHPGTVDTALSKPFQGNVLSRKIFTPDVAAAQLLEVVAGSEPDHHGRVLAYDGSVIPW